MSNPQTYVFLVTDVMSTFMYIKYKVYSVHCTLYNVHGILSVQCTL